VERSKGVSSRVGGGYEEGMCRKGEGPLLLLTQVVVPIDVAVRHSQTREPCNQGMPPETSSVLLQKCSYCLC